jgi:hypothetical protein
VVLGTHLQPAARTAIAQATPAANSCLRWRKRHGGLRIDPLKIDKMIDTIILNVVAGGV